VITFPKAKINLGLRIAGKRQDGFHDIETIFYPVSLSDALEFVEPAQSLNEDELVITGINISGPPDQNLVLRAVRKLRQDYIFPYFRIHLHKGIPSGSGLGGGSSDAAIMLKAINKCYGLSIGGGKIKKYALELGSDCPFFLNPVPSFATGRGEVLKPLEPLLSGYHLLLIDPGVSISTRDAYLNCRISGPGSGLAKVFEDKPSVWREYMFNDFEDYVFTLYPRIREMRDLLYQAGAVFR